MGPRVILVANSRRGSPSRSRARRGPSAKRSPRFFDASAAFATGVTVGSGPDSVGGDLDALSDDFEWVLLDRPRINDDGPSRRGERSERLAQRTGSPSK